jgi:deoxyribodipyrimidine photolyase-related protein
LKKSATIIFPHQLFEEHPGLEKGRPVWLIEEPLFFVQYPFHAQKLVYHRATMKNYANKLIGRGYKINYIEAHDKAANTEQWVCQLFEMGIHEVFISDPTDYLLHRRIVRYSNRMNVRVNWLDSPNFLSTNSEISTYFSQKKRFFLTSFYIDERKKRKLLVDAADQPTGGQWTFDEDNRKKMPANVHVPELTSYAKDSYYHEALDYVKRLFPNAWGKLEAPIYPLDSEQSRTWLHRFCEERLDSFGTYQDAMHPQHRFGFHSVLTPILNIGLIQPQEILKTVIEIGQAKGIEINNIEGFVRQVMGWREYIRAVYQLKGVEARNRHFWNHHHPMPASFWNGNTGIAPIDDMIKGVGETAYAHHIERLMLAGNFMLLCEIDADEVYRWFMALFIDAYDWVMVPNVYGMSQFADGGLMSTKPYISGSNYVLKMSHYSKGPWCAIWDGLYWRFIDKHRDFFLRNPRMAMMVRTFDKMDIEKRGLHLQTAKDFLVKLHGLGNDNS